MMELLSALASAAGALASQPWFLALAGLLSAVGIFLAKHFLTRIGDDLYHWMRRKIFRRRVNSVEIRSEAPAEFRPFQIETAVDRYAITDQIARGDLCSIFAARGRNGREVIVKLALNTGDNDLLQNEAHVLKTLRAGNSTYNKHLPEFLDQFRAQGGEIGLVLERIQGYDLRSVREKYASGIPQQHIIWIFRRALAVVGHAHSRGIIHGNIDPSHIMISAPDHNAFLIDWGYAVERPAETGQGFRVINEVFSPPEVAEKKQPLPASDLFSLGKCMIYLLGGNVQSDSMPDNVDPRIQDFIRFFTRTSALQRPQDAWEMYARLDRLREEVFGHHRFIEFKM